MHKPNPNTAPDDPVEWVGLLIEEGQHLYVDGEEMRAYEEVVAWEARAERWTEKAISGVQARSRDVATVRTLGRRSLVRMPAGHPYWTQPQLFVEYNTSSAVCAESNPLSRLHHRIESLNVIADRWRANPPVPPKPVIAATGGVPVKPPESGEAEHRPLDKRQRNRDVETDALLKNRINAVLAKARATWPDPESRPGINEMARLLAASHPGRKVEGYGSQAIRQILMGIYRPARDRGIPGLSG